MALEPQVEQSIRNHRKSVLLHRVLPLLPLLILLILAVTVLSVVGKGWATGGDDPLFTRSFNPLVLILMLALPLVFAGIPFFLLLRPATKQFNSLLSEAGSVDGFEYERFRNRLEAVSIGLGIRAPELAVLDFPTGNTLSFNRRGATVGVTGELLQSGLSGSEIEAVMAHQAAHVAAGDSLRSPNFLRGTAGILVILISLVVPAFYIVKRPGYLEVMLLVFVYVILSFIAVILSMRLWLRPYSISRLNPEYYYGDILADSVATKLTGNPGALESAIKKVRDGVADAEEMPGQTIAYTHLFVSPLKRWGVDLDTRVPTIMEAMPVRRGADPATRAITKWLGGPAATSYDPHLQTIISGQMEGFVQWESRLIEARLENLRQIKKNRWEAFEVLDSRLVVPPDRWD